MISIRQSLSELEKAERLREFVVECYRGAIISAAQYAIDLDDKLTPAHRKHLTQLAESVNPDLGEAGLEESRGALRNELRDYRDSGARFLSELREELAGKAASLQRIFEAMAAGDDDHEARIVKALAALREIAADSRAAALRKPLVAAADSLAQSLEELKRQNQMTVAQFLVEVSLLHNRIESLQTAAATDAATRLLSRGQMEGHLATAVSSGRPFLLIVLKARNLGAIRRQFGEKVLETLLAAFAKRLRNCLPKDEPAGRWGDEQFAVLLTESAPSGRAIARRAAEHTAGVYVCMEDGKPRRPVLQVDVGVVDSVQDESLDRLIQRVEAFFRCE